VASVDCSPPALQAFPPRALYSEGNSKLDWAPRMATGLCAHAAAEYLPRSSFLARIGKAALPIAGEYLSLNRILMARRRHDPLILCYHGVVPDEIAEDPQRYGNLVSYSEFAEQMSLLAQVMTPISLSELDRWLHGGSALPANPVLITFDDGYRNNLLHAAPTLLKFGVPAVFFITVGYIGTDSLLWPTEIYRCVLLWPSPLVPLPDGSTLTIPAHDLTKRIALAGWVREFCKTIPDKLKNKYLMTLREAAFPALTRDEAEMFSFLSWEETDRLRRMGFEIGSHTLGHCILTRTCTDRGRRELEMSRQQLERNLGTSCVTVAYPNGCASDYSPQVLSAAAQAGYKLGFTTRAGVCTRSANPLALNRICIPGKLSKPGFQSRISGLHDLLKSQFT
jgi:peptidoglycan/xylan/chitin deacetylase (PgdA/CDA1 family)